MENLLSIVGSIASIGAAIWAYYQAISAKKSASDAKRYRDELIKKRKIVEVSALQTETMRILKVVSKVGPSCTEKNIRGIKSSDIAKEVEEFSRMLNTNKEHFTELFDNKAQVVCKKLEPLIESLSEATNFSSIKSTGKEIYYTINDFAPEVKELVDKHQE